MIIVHHRINTHAKLKHVPRTHGVEVDVRGYGKKLILNHEPLRTGEQLKKYLKHYKHRFIIFNVKEAGIEYNILELAKHYGIHNYFLLDVEFPYIMQAAARREKNVAIRYSEYESIHTVLPFRGKISWVWIDTVTRLPLDSATVKQLKGFKTALVCPERWGRPNDIPKYIKKMKALNFRPDMVMTDSRYADLYERSFLRN